MEIIGIAGEKCSGKDSAAKYITGMVMHHLKLITKYDMNKEGDLIVTYEDNSDGTCKQVTDILDLDRHDDQFLSITSEFVWPHVRIYHLADSLKYILANMFRLDLNVLFGTQAQKESLSPIIWDKMVDVIPKKKLPKKINLEAQMSYRQVMQCFGDVMRNIDDTCFIHYCLDEINRFQCPISIIADLRRSEEIEAIKATGGMLIYLTKSTDSSPTHDTENQLKTLDKSIFDIVIDNQNMSIEEKNKTLFNALQNRGFLQ